MAIELKKIEFKDYQEPAVDSENLNKMQQNIEEAINEGAGSGDGILTGSIIGWNKDEIPEGYEEVPYTGGEGGASVSNTWEVEDETTVAPSIELVKNQVPFKLGIDANGNYGYIKAGADTVTPFKTSSDRPLSVNYSGWGDNTVNSKSFTIPAESTEAIIICTTVREGNDDTGTCTITNGSGKITALTSYGYSGGYNAGTYWKTIWWKLTKTAGTATTVKVAISNPYGHVGANLQVVYN